MKFKNSVVVADKVNLSIKNQFIDTIFENLYLCVANIYNMGCLFSP